MNKETKKKILRATTKILNRYGCWGICFTYGTWFGVEALVACQKNYQNSRIIRKACEFLISKQLPCGGWGESYLSLSNKVHMHLVLNREFVLLSIEPSI